MCHLSAKQKDEQFRLSEIVLDIDFGKSEILRHMEPAKSIIEKLGGEAVVSKITETAYTAPYRWQTSREKGGTGGLIPQRHHPKLLSYAQEHQIELIPGDFLPAAEATACV